MNLRKLKQIAKVSFLINIVIATYIFFYASDPIKREEDEPEVRHFPWYKRFSLSFDDKSCTKSVLLFGMKQHWKEFLAYDGMSRMKYLIEFPRIISCPGANCSVVLNYSEDPKEIPGYDVVAFTNVYVWLTPDMWAWARGNRTLDQRWIMISNDSPLYVPGFQPPTDVIDSTYDWIGSYKSDSAVFQPYGRYTPYGKDEKPPDIDLTTFLKNKKKQAAWMSSNCQTSQWNRYQFVEDLRKIVHVDKYGKCGDAEVPWNDEKSALETFSKYKFYLSLENSCCDDYITDKFWRALEMGLVPIVVGASYDQYAAVAPPHSFIHVDEFKSMAEFEVYINSVSNNDGQYLEYFKWRNSGTISSRSQEEHYTLPLANETYCNVLRKLLDTDPLTTTKRINYFGAEWYGSCYACGNNWIKDYEYKT